MIAHFPLIMTSDQEELSNVSLSLCLFRKFFKTQDSFTKQHITLVCVCVFPAPCLS